MPACTTTSAPKPERQHGEEVGIGAKDGFVDDQLELERHGEGHNLQCERQQQHLREGRSAHRRAATTGCESFMGVRAVTGWKPLAGDSSSTTPVKCLETSAIGIVRRPKAGS